VKVLIPAPFTVTLYEPDANPVNANCPSLPDGTFRTSDGYAPTNVTCAPCSTSPFASTTVPEILAVLDGAWPVAAD
jgi:hypothetical protein